jgi:hypothetical protein
MSRSILSLSSLAYLAMGSMALQYQDCSLQADFSLIEVEDYVHSPDPTVSSQEHTTTKTLRYTGRDSLLNLYEIVTVDKSLVGPDDPTFNGWTSYFNNSYEISDKHGDEFPVSSNASFVISDLHSPSSSTGAWFRAVEHYYTMAEEGSKRVGRGGDADGDDKLWIGCLSVMYQTVD